MNPTVTRRTRIWADLGLVYAAAIWGSTFFLVKDALSGIDPVVMVGYRFLLAGATLLPFVLITRRRILANWGKSLFLSVILWLLYVPQTVGLKYTTASNSGFITGLFVAFTPLFLVTLFRKMPSRGDIIATVISLAGLWVLTGGLRDINPGDMLTLLAAATYALHVLYSDKYMKAGVDPYVISCQQFILVGALSLLTALVMDYPFAVTSSMAIKTVVFLALFPSLSAFVIQMLAQRITAPMKVSLIFALEPVFAALFAWTVGGEEFVTRRALGGLLIVAALIVSGLSARNK